MSKYFNANFRLKTEKAIELINLYENNHSELSKFQFLAKDFDSLGKMSIRGREVQQNTWVSIQLLPQTFEFIEIRQNIGQSPKHLKMLFKHFSGLPVRMSISTKSQPIPAEMCQYWIGGEKVLKIGSLFSPNSRYYITFHSKSLTLFKFKYELACEQISKSSSSVTRLDSLSKINTVQHEQLLRDARILSLKNNIKSPRAMGQSEMKSARLESQQSEKVKMSHARDKRSNLSLLQQKSKSLSLLSRQCKGLLQEYQEQIKQYRQRLQDSGFSLAKLIFIAKFAKTIVERKHIHQNGIDSAVKLRKTVRKVASRFMQINHQLQRIAPVCKIRQLLGVSSSISLYSKIVLPNSTKRASKIIIGCLSSVFLGLSINKAFACASEYRSKVRHIQRYWISRNKAQISMFKFYIQVQTEDLCKSQHFALLAAEFKQKCMIQTLSWQYLRQSSSKLKNIRGSYLSKLVEIEQMKLMNQQIEDFNSTALRKHQKQLLIVPHVPVVPQTRYFRDLHLLKSLVRTWFQIEHRKYLKRTKKQRK